MARATVLRISDYRVVTAGDARDLADGVGRMMVEGWQPIGGVAVSLSESDEHRYVVYAQAVIRLSVED